MPYSLGAAVGSAVSGPFKVSGFSASYANDGLVGVHLALANDDVYKGVTTAASAIKKVLAGDISDTDLVRAKAQTRRQLIPETHSDITRTLCTQYLYNSTSTAQDLAQLDSLTLSDVKRTAQQVGSSRPFLAARGPLDDLPYLETLGF